MSGITKVSPLARLVVLSFAASLLCAAPASAATVTNDRPLLFAFDGSDSSIGKFTAPVFHMGIAIDEASGDVFVINVAGTGKGPTGYGPGPGEWDDERVLCRFDAEGKAESFTAGSSAGKSCLDGKDTPEGAFGVEGFFSRGALTADVAIDNSGGAGGPGEGEQGRIYLSESSGPIHAFDPGGGYRWTLSSEVVEPCGIAVDTEGDLWVVDEGKKEALEFDSTGGLTGAGIPLPANQAPCRPGIDQSGNSLYVADFFELTVSEGVEKYVGGSPDSILTATKTRELTIDQSQALGRIFLAHVDTFSEYEPCAEPGCPGKEVVGSPFGGDLIGSARGIAYNPTLDRVYVADAASSTVKVFGPVASGTVPDLSCQATDAIGLHEATAHCTIDPLSLPHSYHFEWKRCTSVECSSAGDANWATASSSFPQSIEPTDSESHQVSLPLTGLKSNATYQVRLVGTNKENDLSGYSLPDTFATLSPPPPEIEDESCAISAITTESAHLACTIEPFGEETTWRVERSTDPACTSGFSPEPTQTIPEGEAGTVAVEWDLEGLLPAQRYCLRLGVSGPGGETTSTAADFDEAKDTFRTLAVPPTQAEAAFAAPRTDTTARINARANPQGEADLTYRFEVSSDEGKTWTLLPERTASADARKQILLAEELTGLEPNTTYRYRLAAAANEAGPAPSLGTERTFTTRTTAEMTLPANALGQPNRRGIELVNNPDKGNQAAIGYGVGASPLSPDGERMTWGVIGGAPGGPNGTESNFLATRTPTGWSSLSINPPVSEQLGGGEFVYGLAAASPELDAFILTAQLSTGLAPPPPPIGVARVRPGIDHEVLRTYDVQLINANFENTIEVSDDGSHVIAVNPQTLQLEDIGTPGKPEVVGLMPDGSPSECSLDIEGESFGLGGLRRPGYRMIDTTDASLLYFQLPANGDCDGPYRLWVRDREAKTTTEIDKGAEFIRATPDGAAAYLATQSQLDPADANSGTDVYRWDQSAAKASCLTCEAVADAQVQIANTDVLVSDDFSHVYFHSKAQLVPGQGTPGDLNLYVLKDKEVRFIANPGHNVLGNVPGGETSGPDAHLSADGEVLLFHSPASPALSADAMAAQCVSADSGELSQCTQLYRYDDRDASIECISCRHGALTTHSVGAPGRPQHSFRLSGDGTTVGFVTQQALVPLDVNRDSDVYEWRNGALRLISDGVSDFPEGEVSAPQVVAVDNDGSDILFELVPPGGRLTGFEQDGVLNLYDARIGGGFAPPSPSPRCAEDSCQGPLLAPPEPQRAASSQFAGRGNQRPGGKSRRPCAKKRGKAKRRCQARQRRRAAHARQGRRR